MPSSGAGEKPGRRGAGPSRPRYHVTAPSNWLSDPNGPIHHEGRYHLFYQYNPVAPRWGRPHWGHVSSPDLIHWEDHPVALTPSAAGPDRDGCWSGCARIVDGRPVIFYTGVVGEGAARVESVCRADGSPDLMTWSPRPTPLLAGPPAGLDTSAHRDPFVFRHAGGRWRMLIGSGLHGRNGRAGAILLYESTDLARWTYLGVLYQRPEGEGPINTGAVWECPQLLRLHGHDVLVFSVQMPDHPQPLRYAVYVVGRIEDTDFHPGAMGLIDHGDVFYAPAITTDAWGRHVMWGWLQETSPAERSDPDHVGALSLPRQLDLVRDRVAVRPVPELTAARSRPALPTHLGRGTSEGQLLEPPGAQYELALAVGGRTGTVTLELLEPDGRAACRITVDRAVDVATLQPRGGEALPMALSPSEGRPVTFRTFVDASIVEVFLGGQCAAATRVSHHDGSRLRLRADGDVTVTGGLFAFPRESSILGMHEE